MKPGAALFLLAFLSLSVQNARADAIRFPTSFSTTGSFSCRAGIECSGEGTNAITFGSGADTATVTFTGVNTSLDVTNHVQRVPFGDFTLTATEGFTFPTHPNNPTQLSILRFSMKLHQMTPVDAGGSRGKEWLFGPGGREDLSLRMGQGYFVRPVGPNPFGYNSIVYTVTPFPFTMQPNTTTSTFADVGAVPEPGSMLLLATGLLGTAIARRRGRRAANTPRSALHQELTTAD
jgi:hypothetical protein